MKTRQGFVSNSSSSSFVILGVQYSGSLEELAEKLGYVENEEWETERHYLNCLMDFGYIFGSHTKIVGYPLAVDSYDGSGALCDHTIDLATAVCKAEKILEKLGIHMPLKIYSGSKFV